MRRRFLFVPLCAFAVACAPATHTDSSPAPSRDVLFAREIVRSQVSSVYQAIAQLRPEFFRIIARAGPGPLDRTGVRVYLDNMELGSVETLHSMSVDRVTVIRFLNASEAMLRWGPSTTNGVILISTARNLSSVTP